MESLTAIAAAAASELRGSDFIRADVLHKLARNAGATIAYVSPDDRICLYGKADDELGIGPEDIRTLWVDADSVLPVDSDGNLLGLDDLAYFINIKDLESLVDAYRGAARIDVYRQSAGGAWRLTTKAPHAYFNVYDGDRLHCVGIVFKNPEVSWNA